MTPHDFTMLENAELAAYVDFYRAAPADIREAYGLTVREVGTATCVTCRGVEPAAVFRRAVGLGVGRAASEAELDDVLAQMNAGRQKYVVTVAPHSQPPALAAWLESRGFVCGYAWMKFDRLCSGASRVASDLEVRVIGSELAVEYGQVVTQGFGLPPEIAPWVGELAGRPNWVCVMAFAGATPVAAGAVYLNGEYAWLGFGATLPSYRRRGAQSALLARRLSEAAARGARVAVTETGERLPGKPSTSYQNILRAGFEEMYVRQNYMSP
jgi:GNAT superfamily N-acetyltransferase